MPLSRATCRASSTAVIAVATAGLALAHQAWARQGDDCALRVQLMERRLSAAVDEENELRTLKVREQLPRVGAEAIGNERGPVLEILRQGLTLDGRLLAWDDESSWRADLAQYKATAAALGVPPPAWFYLLTDRSTDLSKYLGFLATFGSHYELRLIVEPKRNRLAGLLPDRVPAGALRLLSRLAGFEDTVANTGTKATIFAEEFARASGHCKAMARIYDLVKAPMPERSRQFVRVSTESARQCGCDSGLDVDAFEYIALRLFAAFQYPRRIFRLRFSRNDGETLDLGHGPTTAQRLAEAVSVIGRHQSGEVIRVRLRPPSK